MRLTKLEIFGFKSFAKRTEIVFPQNVTGIVGPNGSGKSNISDAVRWVLGEQSARVLRGNNMADVIFNGTQTKKPMNYCEVTLVFDNGDRQLPIDFAEVSITRRVYRSGESEYQMNGASCRLKDIVELFRDTGVGKEGYSIIGQGRIDEILSQRSEDRRAVFEEAAGISRFRTRKEEAENRLLRADENLLRVLDVLEELKNHLAPLEKQAEVAKEFLALSEELKELDVELFLVRHQRLHSREVAMEQALLSVKDALMEAGARLTQVTADRDQAEETVEALQKALSEAHAALLEKNELLHRTREDAANIQNRLRRGAETAQRLEGEMEAVRARMTLIQASMTQSDGGLAQANLQREEAQRLLEKRQQAHQAATAAAQEWEDQLTAHKAAIIESMNRMQSVRTTQARQTAMQSQMTARKEELAQELAAGEEKERLLESALAAAQENLKGEEARYGELKAEADALEASTKAMLADILAKQKALQEGAQSARALETRLRTFKELQEGLEGYQHSVRNALQFAKRQSMAGVRGVVGMLLTVPKELETAMDMALGAAMQNIVTDDEHSAKRLIEYLRQNHLGRATFLPLSTVRGRTLSHREREALSMEGCLGVASELCSFEEAYRPVFENLLGRTVVARDLDSGIAIMRAGGHAFRLVTLAGDVMHSGGSMTGGSIQQKAQNLLGREREIKELTQALAEKTEYLQKEQAALTALEEERAASKENRERAQYALHQQEIAVVRDTERQQAAQQELQQHRAAAQGLRSAIEQLEESLAGIAAELERIASQTDAEQMGTEEMNARTQELSDALGVARRERENTQEALTAAMLRLQEAEHHCERIQRDQKRLMGDSDGCLREIEVLVKKREEALADVAAATREQERCAVLLQQGEQVVANARTHVEETEAKRDAAQRAFKDLQSEIEAEQLMVNRETDRLHRQEMALAKVKAELAQLTDRLWDTYELTYAGAQEAQAEYALLRKNARREAQGESPCGAEAAPTPFNEAAADEKAQEIRERIRRMGTVNVGAIEEYAQMHERYTQLTTQKEDLEQAKVDLQDLIQRLLERMEAVFVSQFTLLQEYFAQTFTRLFGGGTGEIRLSDPSDPLNCGIEIIVQPPGKKRQILSLFSGGERALTAIAILFAMLMLKPTPFCILDEIEAALDEANIGYFADYLKEFSQDTQFIVVTHRKGTMERCDTLFGVAMEERGVSSMVSVNLTDYD